LLTIDAASRDAASGRHRKATSAAFSSRARSAFDPQQLDVAAARQVFVDAQAGGAFLTVDVDLECHDNPSRTMPNGQA
jgi:hypothetical protein